MTKPFIKWAGGKYRLADKFIPLLPLKFNSTESQYFEPMIGSGGFFFKYLPQKAYLSDINFNLINTYNVIKNDVENLIVNLKIHEFQHDGKYFYKMRDKFNKLIKNNEDLTEIAALFIYLNRTCFNGLYRENSKGEFNVPIGKYKNPTICNEKNLRSVNKLLKNIEIKCHGYDSIKPNEGDFVYFDPPYIPLEKTSFTKYSSDDFFEKDHRLLMNFCRKLDQNGVYFMISNSNTSLTKEIYSNFNIKEIQVMRTIAGSHSKRGIAKELVITNYSDFAQQELF
ncbi:DNA adenine methylase [Candidatus Marinimicrobia bacterium]|nr:DNA adenine methylase [Candidatus Neomarinimicrobiota bacterium]